MPKKTNFIAAQNNKEKQKQKFLKFLWKHLYVNILQLLYMTICLRIASKKCKLKNNKLNSVESQASCVDEYYLFF